MAASDNLPGISLPPPKGDWEKKLQEVVEWYTNLNPPPIPQLSYRYGFSFDDLRSVRQEGTENVVYLVLYLVDPSTERITNLWLKRRLITFTEVNRSYDIIRHKIRQIHTEHLFRELVMDLMIQGISSLTRVNEWFEEESRRGNPFTPGESLPRP